MRLLTENTPLASFIGFYGEGSRSGLISDHVEAFKRAGGEIRPGHSHAGWAVVDGKGYPILCSEIVRIDTEDGPISGRCGNFALANRPACTGHDYRYDED